MTTCAGLSGQDASEKLDFILHAPEYLAIIDGIAARLRQSPAGGDQLRAEGAERCAQEIRRLLLVYETETK